MPEKGKIMQYPKDDKIRETFLKVEKEYRKSDAWHLRITADELNCPISYVRDVLMSLEEKGEL